MQQSRPAMPAAAISIPRTLADHRVLSPAAVGMAGVTLTAVVAMLIGGRIGRRLWMAVLIAGGALLGGGAILDGLQTAIAITR